MFVLYLYFLKIYSILLFSIQNQSNSGQMDSSFFDQLQHLQQLLMKKDVANEPKSSVKFDKKLLDFDYGEEEDDDVVVTNSPNTAASANTQHNTVSNSSLESLGLLLANPEVLTEENLIAIQMCIIKLFCMFCSI